MHKKYILVLAILIISTTATFAKIKVDSIGFENYKGKKTVIYKVEAKETYYSISKKYNLNYKQVMEFNDNQLLQIGIVIKVPTQIPFDVGKNPLIDKKYTAAFEYTIIAKDNLNMLAEKYGTTIDELKRINNLTSINLQIGQIIQIPNTGKIIEEKIVTPVTTYSPPINSVQSVIEPTAATTHTIKAKENLNLIAKMYDTTVEEIKILNGLTSNNLQIGQILNIPSGAQVSETLTEAKIKEVPTVTVEKKVEKLEVQKPIVKPAIKTEQVVNDGSIEHVVAASETIYSIAKKYNTTTYQIKTFNNLTSNDLNVGQKLKIKSLTPTSVAEIDGNNTLTDGESIIAPTLNGAPSKYGISQVEEKGVAVWILDQDLDPAKMLILHRTAPIGTVIKITNPMTSRSTFAKVVGKFTENESTKDVIIVMTKAVADAIGALDKRFACTLSYGALENEQ